MPHFSTTFFFFQANINVLEKEIIVKYKPCEHTTMTFYENKCAIKNRTMTV